MKGKVIKIIIAVTLAMTMTAGLMTGAATGSDDVFAVTNPPDGTAVTGTVSILGIAAAKWVNVAAFGWDGIKVANDAAPTNGSFTLTLDTTKLPNGPYTVSLFAFSVLPGKENGLSEPASVTLMVANGPAVPVQEPAPPPTPAVSHPAVRKGPPAYPVKISDNGRYLVDQNNAPFIIAGIASQLLAVQISSADAELYFTNRASYGFDAVWISLLAETDLAHRPDGSTYDQIRPFTGYLSGHSGDPQYYDLTTPNPAYFHRCDQMITLAAKHSLLVFLDPLHTRLWTKLAGHNGVSACQSYGRYLGKRYKGFKNIVWLNGEDFTTWKNPDDDAVILAIAKGIKSVDPGRLQTIEFMWNPSSDDPAWAPIISLNLAYTYEQTYLQMLQCYNRTPVLPVFLGEAHYELSLIGWPPDTGTPPVLRRQGYWTMLCGGCGQIYGSGYSCIFKSGWKENLDTHGAAQFKLWKNFFDSLPWYNLAPDQTHTVVTAGFGNKGDRGVRVSKSDYCTAARTSDGAFVVAYLPTMRTITVNMASLKAPARARWFDPADGTYTPVSDGPLANTGTRQFAPPPGKNHDGDGDWVLLLDASGRP